MISDDITQANRQIKNRAVSAENKWWSDTQKLECVKTFLMTGNLAMTGRILKIPEETVRRWRKTTWRASIVDDLKSERELVLSSRLQKIIDKSLDVVEDRLEHGDFVYDQKSGTMRRKLVPMRDAHKVGIDLQARQDIILNRQAPQASEEQIDAKLNKLAAKFAAIVNGRQPPSEEIVDVQSKMVLCEPLSSEILSDNEQDDFGENLQEVQDGSSNGDGTGDGSSLGRG